VPTDQGADYEKFLINEKAKGRDNNLVFMASSPNCDIFNRCFLSLNTRKEY